VGLALSLAGLPGQAAAAVPVKNGHYVGVGEDPLGNDLRLDFFVRQHVVEDAFRSFTYGPNPNLPCSNAGAVNDDDAIDSNGRFRLEQTEPNAETVLKGRFLTKTKAKGKMTYTHTTVCPGTYEFAYVVRRVG
jgi:hypothetical protein